MKKKAIIITSAVIAAIVCVIIVLFAIQANQARDNIKNGELPVLSDEGVRDDIAADFAEIGSEPETDRKRQDDDSKSEDDPEPSDENPLDNNDTPFIIG